MIHRISQKIIDLTTYSMDKRSFQGIESPQSNKQDLNYMNKVQWEG